MGIVNTGFGRRRRESNENLPPGQFLTTDFPVLSYGPTPDISTDQWEFEIRGRGQTLRWSWEEFLALPAEDIETDIHCVTHWSKFGTHWRGVSIDTLMADVEDDAPFATAYSYGGYTTNVPMEDLLDGKAWIAYEFEGEPLEAEHGGPARLLVPHLYLWKSAKWCRGLTVTRTDEPGFWERYGYHSHGDPWRQQRYDGD